MEISLNNYILAIVTIHKDKVATAGIPTFYCQDEEEREQIATYLSRITNGAVHDLQNGVYIIVRH